MAGAVLFFVSFVVGNIAFPIHKVSSFHFWKSWKLIWQDRDIRKSMWSYTFSGISRNGSLERVLLPIFIFDVLQSELDLGGWLSFFALVSVVFSVTAGRYINYKYYRKMIILGGLGMFLIISSLSLYPVFLVYIIFGVAKEIISILMKIPKRVISENLVHNIPDYDDHRIEYFIVREWFGINFGRLLSYAILLFVGGLSTIALKYVIFMMAVSILIEVSLLLSIKTDVAKV